MRTPALALLTAAALTLGGCEHTPGALMSSPEAQPMRLASADQSFRLDPQQRETISPGYDVEALERMLSMIRPDLRAEILENFQVRKKPIGLGEGWVYLVQINDPKLQEVLEEVWAPMWDNAPDQALEENWYQWPGREIAKQRRTQLRGGNP